MTAEMLIHCDVDDEQTLIEAEALESVGEVEEEVADLQQVHKTLTHTHCYMLLAAHCS